MSFDIESLKVFVRVAELQSFTEAARQLRMPKARASAHVQRLEGELGVQLLQRSTRLVRPTPEGELLVSRARTFLSDAEEITGLFQSGRSLRGRVRIEMPVTLACDFVIPRLPDLISRHPELHVDIGASDRVTTASRDGIDIALRIGPVNEPGLTGRRIGESQAMNCASSAYLREHGTPHTLEDLKSHLIVHYVSDPTPVFEYREGKTYKELPMRSIVTVDNMDAYEAAGMAGLGIVQLPRPREERLAGKLVEILPDLEARPSPLTLLHTHGRTVPRRVRAVMDWLEKLLVQEVSRRERARNDRAGAAGAT